MKHSVAQGDATGWSPRRVSLVGAANFRDLGGHLAATGATVRHGLLYRADSLHRLTAGDVEVLLDLGLRTVIDLRRESERSATGVGPLDAVVARSLNLPLLGVGIQDEPVRLSPSGKIDLVELYCDFVEYSTTTLQAIFALLGDPNSYPAVVHCTAGKDRTGIVAAIILAALGVDDNSIAEDYAATASSWTRFVELVSADSPGTGPKLDEVPRELLNARAETMLAFLGRLRERFGSIQAFLDSVGVGCETVAALRQHLLTPPA